MIITREIPAHGNHCPAAVNVLRQVPADALFNISHQLRHPESIYRLSLEKLAVRFTDVAECYRRITEQHRNAQIMETLEIEDLLGRQQNFLHALQEHIDELWLILKTFVDPATSNANPVFSNHYVLENRLAGARSFLEAISPYKKSLQIVNKLKHQQGHLRGVAMWTISGIHLGYFLEEPDHRGALGPSLEIHPDQAAFSFARDLLWHFTNIYNCSEKLSIAIQRALDAKGLQIRSTASPGLPEWNSALESALTIPDAFYPSDSRRGIPFLTRNDQEQRLTLRFPRRVIPNIPRILKVGCTIKIDGHSPSFKTPLV